MVALMMLAIGVGAVAGGAGLFLVIVTGIHREPAEFGPGVRGGLTSLARRVLGVAVVRPERR
ncbi:MAG TPA: hypothetical protein VH478_10550 [Trebonia sp.]|jgi:hypothetical protein|nr:hypothetical protein [Trebonia sp.]